ncbi:FCD domain-containing protein [Halomonas desiderata]|jgi:GntR family carbon starvation induced transcriptional regulator|uniref:FCD domain-containing protein n=1 Tax=Billgrantia aerodenitrificans TaxID=2733483 RepID=A0ABS9ALK5_9GAMM|nr:MULTISPECIES: FCD domain-containing protein [Halomonas]MCE8022685.1 FCD domain-containing protein [Halomonas aerodenitrificans]MCE8037914.1 FCD domain-containing protein [Halomonas sp. MCCC 1A11062]NIC37789.1 FCD domain-containing protein [Halomonas desiderata]
MTETLKQGSATAASRIYETLRQDLLNGRYRAGERLSITLLRETYDVGLSPLREALNRLAAYGLLRQENQRGFRVLELTREELADITEMRRQLEGMALELAIRHGDEEWESQLLAANHRLARAGEHTPVVEWESLHSRFHSALVAPCGSAWLLRFISQLHDQFDRYRRVAPRAQELRHQLDSQHQELVDLALTRDARRARALIEEHITLSSEVAKRSCR